jgi:hypothetical protein
LTDEAARGLEHVYALANADLQAMPEGDQVEMKAEAQEGLLYLYRLLRWRRSGLR